MDLTEMIWIVPALLLLGVTAWFANGIRRIGAVSSGDPIDDRSGVALLLIDLQTVFWDAGNFTEIVKSKAEVQISAEINAARSSGIPVIAIRHEWSIPATKAVAKLLMKGQAIEGTPGTEIAEPFNAIANHTVVKRVQDAFETKELDKLLEELNIETLRLVGLDTNHCVAKTALAACQRGYNVEIVKRGVLSADPKTADKTLEMLNEKGVMLR